MRKDYDTDDPARDREPSPDDDDLFAEIAANPDLTRVVLLLAARPKDREMAGLDRAVLDFRAHAAARQRRPAVAPALVGAKLAATIAGIAVGLGGAATVALVSANVPLKPATPAVVSSSHVPPSGVTSSADQAERSVTSSTTGHGSAQRPGVVPAKPPATAAASRSTAAAAGPDASGSAARGLCAAWQDLPDSGKAKSSTAFEALVKAAGGADRVDAYCAAPDSARTANDRGEAKNAQDRPASGSDSTATAPTSHPTGRS